MGKAARKRKAARAQYFQQLAQSDPARYQLELAKRIFSWVAEIKRRASRLNGPGAFEIMEQASEELGELEGSKLYDVLENECCQALAREIDPRLYRLSKLAAGLEKLERERQGKN